MVYYDHNRIMVIQEWKIGDEVHSELLEGEDGERSDGCEWRDGRMSVNFTLLTDSAAVNKVFDKCLTNEVRPGHQKSYSRMDLVWKISI